MQLFLKFVELWNGIFDCISVLRFIFAIVIEFMATFIVLPIFQQIKSRNFFSFLSAFLTIFMFIFEKKNIFIINTIHIISLQIGLNFRFRSFFFILEQCNTVSVTTTAAAETEAATTSNGGSAYITQSVQTHSNQNGMVSIASVPPTSLPSTATITAATITETATTIVPISSVKTSNTDGGMVPCQYERFTTGSIINEKQINHNRTNSNDDTAYNDQLLSENSSNANDMVNVSEKRELNFQNLELKCMCSDDGEAAEAETVMAAVATVAAVATTTAAARATASGIANLDSEPIQGNKHHICGDDETDIEISDVEAVTEIEESMLKSHRCSHCGRDHCCFLLRCCYCKHNEIGTSNAEVNALYKTSSCENDFDTHSNNITSDLPTTDKCTHSNQNQNLASKRCDEICKIIHNESGGAKCNTIVAAAAVNQQCCDGNTQTNVACHCRWYCIQDCDLDAKANTVASIVVDDCKKDETTLAVQKPEIVSPITNESPLNDENRLRCCRCSKELF